MFLVCPAGMRSKQAPKAAADAPKAAKKAAEPSVQGGDLDPKSVALPGGSGPPVFAGLSQLGWFQYEDRGRVRM